MASSSISLHSNIAALKTKRHLQTASDKLQESFDRLSSGLRITRASDDAAGLSIATSLNVDSRVFNQGIRNLNDSISMLHIAEGAVREASNVLIRLEELAIQSANGVYSNEQRQALDAEAQELVDEYNRIVESTKFNSRFLLDGSFGTADIQAGYGSDSAISVTLGEELKAKAVGDGTFQDRNVYGPTGNGGQTAATGDVNGDGYLDFLVGNQGDNKIDVYLGNGDGTFQSRVSYVGGADVNDIALGDVNGDGVLDIVSTTQSASFQDISVLIGNGDGTFKSLNTYATTSDNNSTTLGDVNNDGALDVVVTVEGSNKVEVLLGNGDGSFQARLSFSTGNVPFEADLADVNGDGDLDMVVRSWNAIDVFLGNGDGSFGSLSSYAANDYAIDISLSDLNGDGNLDVVTADRGSNTALVLLGNADGSFQASLSFATDGDPREIELADLNGDDSLDLVLTAHGSDVMNVLIGNGDGSFSARQSYATGDSPEGLAVGDFTDDGVSDIVTIDRFDSTYSVFIANSFLTGGLPDLDLSSQSAALNSLVKIESAFVGIQTELAGIGSNLSRHQTAVANLEQTVENYQSAASRILDADIAEEAANLIKREITQRAAVSVLGQANQVPSLVLNLLNS